MRVVRMDKFSRLDSLPNFLTHGAPLRARFARARAPLKIASVKNKDEGDLKHLSLHFLIPRGTLLAQQNKSLPVTNARRPINLSTSVWRMEISVDPTKLLPAAAAILEQGLVA